MKTYLVHQQDFVLQFRKDTNGFVGSEIIVKVDPSKVIVHSWERSPLLDFLQSELNVEKMFSSLLRINITLDVRHPEPTFFIHMEGEPLKALCRLIGSDKEMWYYLEFKDCRVDWDKESHVPWPWSGSWPAYPINDVLSQNMTLKKQSTEYFCQGTLPDHTMWWSSWMNPDDWPGAPLKGKMSVVFCVKDFVAQEKAQSHQASNNSRTNPIHSTNGQMSEKNLAAKEVAQSSKFSGNNNVINELYLMNRQILEKQIATDLKIIAKNGSSFLCHRSFLQYHSDKFPIQGKKHKRKTLLLSDTPEVTVKLLLKYAYYQDLDETKKDAVIAMDLLVCANQYGMETLEKTLRETLMRMSNNSYNPGDAIKLYRISRKLENSTDLANKAVNIIARKTRSEICCSKEFGEWEEEDSVLAHLVVDALLP